MQSDPEPIDDALIAHVLKRRARAAHKGDFGRVLIIGGGRGMPGAVRLSGEACLRSGAGLVTVAISPGNAAAVIAGRPELICHEVQNATALLPLLESAQVIVIGPGLGRDGWAQEMFGAVLQSDRPLVVDADALNLLAERPYRGHDWVLTPHPGEAARLLNASVTEVQDNRTAAAQELAARYGGIVVLKGAGTLVSSQGRAIEVCERGNPGMATAGMGDVLSGVIAGLLAQIPDAWDAVRVAVLAHAMAGDLAARAGERGLIASDVLAQLRSCLNPPSLS